MKLSASIGRPTILVDAWQEGSDFEGALEVDTTDHTLFSVQGNHGAFTINPVDVLNVSENNGVLFLYVRDAA